MTRTAVVAGVGPGLGTAVARRFASEGCAVGLFARSPDYLETLETELREAGHDALAVPTDVTQDGAVTAGFDAIREAYGPVDVLVYNAGNYVSGGIRELSSVAFEEMWRVAAYGGFLCAEEAVADMLDGDGGTVIFTGATSSLRGPAEGLAFGSAKFAVRGMAQSLARDLGAEGIHVAHAVIDGMIDTPAVREQVDATDEELLDPDAIAAAYWHLVEQDSSAWTLELDLRPNVEEF